MEDEAEYTRSSEIQEVHVARGLVDKEESKNELPLELQCEEIDLNDQRIDPLERTVRKLMPIPRKYYWDAENYNISAKTKVWHNSVYALGRMTHFAESVGEVVAQVLGLNQSRYEYVTSTMTEEEWEEARQISETKRLKRERKRKDMQRKKDQCDALDDAGISHDAL